MKTIIISCFCAFFFSIVQINAQVPHINKTFQNAVNIQQEEMYSIHLASSQHASVDTTLFQQILQTFPYLHIIKTQGPDGWYRFYLGYIYNVDEAFTILNKLKEMGFQSAYIQRTIKHKEK